MTLRAEGGILSAAAGTLKGTAPTAMLKGFNLAAEVNTGSETTARNDADVAKAAGANIARIDLYWQDIEPTTKGVYVWKYADRVFDAVNAAGLRVLWCVSRVPDWARTGTDRYSYPDNPTDFRDFLTAAAARYHARGFTPPAWELWNEPNIDKHVDNVNDLPGFVATMAAGYAGIKTSAPTALVVSGGLLRGGHEYASRPQFVKLDIRWLEEFYAAGGGKGITHDAMGFHPYAYPFDPTDATPTGIDTGPNLVTNPGFEVDASSWFGSRATLARVTTPVQGGTGALRLTADGTGTYGAVSGSANAVEGEYFHDYLWFYSPTTSREFTFRLDYFNSSGGSVGSTLGDIFFTRPGEWIKVGARGTLPVGAARVAVGFSSNTTPPAGEVLYVDNGGLFRSSNDRHGYNRLNPVRAMMRAHGDTSRFWLTEYGQHTGDADSVTEAQQADFLVHAIQRAEERSDVDALFLFNLRNNGTDGTRESTFGIVTAAYAARPSWAPVVAAFGGPGMTLPPPLIFGADFEESAVVTFWADTAGTGLSLETVAPLVGSQSLKYTHVDGNTSGRNTWNAPAGLTDMWVSFLFKPTVLVTSDVNSLHRIFQILTPFVSLEFGHQARVDAFNFNVVGKIGDPTLTAGNTYTILAHHRASTGASDGVTEFFLNGAKFASVTHNTTTAVTGFRLGNAFANMGGLGTGTTFLFDRVRVGRTQASVA